MRRLSPGDDLKPLAAIHAASFADAWDARAIGELLATPGAFAFADDRGFILVRAATVEAEILTLAVSPDARGKGLGRALVIAAASHAQVVGAAEMFLEVAISNSAARALYDGLGFTQAGRRKGYYTAGRETPEDALVLKVQLPLGKTGSTG